jgi:hypothetical protein
MKNVVRKFFLIQLGKKVTYAFAPREAADFEVLHFLPAPNFFGINNF